MHCTKDGTTIYYAYFSNKKKFKGFLARKFNEFKKNKFKKKRKKSPNF